MTQSKLNINDLRKIIKEELTNLNERVDHAGINKVVAGASKLLAAVEAFREGASPSAINAVTPHLDELERVLENMVETPGSYVARPKVEPKKVTLKAVKSKS